nr:hypothetical protein [Bacillus thuringiensis]
MREIRKKLVAYSIVLVFMTGCLPKYIIDDVPLVQGIVFDKVDGKIKSTVVCPVQKKGNQVQIFENAAHTARQAREYARVCTNVCPRAITSCTFY